AVATSGPPGSAYVRGRGASNVHGAPQSVDNDFWGSPDVAPPREHSWPGRAEARFLFVGRPAREKGLEVLLAAWRASGLSPSQAALVLVGAGTSPADGVAGGRAEGGVLRLYVVGPRTLRGA